MDTTQTNSVISENRPSRASYPQSNPDEINLLEYIHVLVKNKWWIIGFTLAGLIIGYIAALIKGPTYVAEAVITAKENDNQKTPNLSAFGALGGMVASQLNVAGNPGLDKIELILGSKKFGAEVIDSLKLLPTLHQLINHKKVIINPRTDRIEYPESVLLKAGQLVKQRFLHCDISNNVLTIKISSKDSAFSYYLLYNYLICLNSHIQKQIEENSKSNIDFLENKMITISDPLLREKLQELIATEYEKIMLVSKQAYEIIDPVYVTISFKEQHLYPLLIGSGLFFLTIMFVIIPYVLKKAGYSNYQ